MHALGIVVEPLEVPHVLVQPLGCNQTMASASRQCQPTRKHEPRDRQHGDSLGCLAVPRLELATKLPGLDVIPLPRSVRKAQTRPRSATVKRGGATYGGSVRKAACASRSAGFRLRRVALPNTALLQDSDKTSYLHRETRCNYVVVSQPWRLGARGGRLSGPSGRGPEGGNDPHPVHGWGAEGSAPRRPATPAAEPRFDLEDRPGRRDKPFA